MIAAAEEKGNMKGVGGRNVKANNFYANRRCPSAKRQEVDVTRSHCRRAVEAIPMEITRLARSWSAFSSTPFRWLQGQSEFGCMHTYRPCTVKGSEGTLSLETRRHQDYVEQSNDLGDFL